MKSRYSLGYVEDGYEPYRATAKLDKWVELASFDSFFPLREALKKSLSFIRNEYLKKAPQNVGTCGRQNAIDSLCFREKNLKFVRLCRKNGIKRDEFPSDAIVIKGLDIPFREFKRLLSVSRDERLFALASEMRRY